MGDATPRYEATPGSWSFSAIGEDFDPHVRRHLPLYEELQELVGSVVAWRLSRDCQVVDVGCATGFTLWSIARSHAPRFRSLGIDPVPEMIDAACRRVEALPGPRRPQFVEGALPGFDLPPTDVLLALFSLQFVPTPVRVDALEAIARALRPGALVVVAEKCEASNAQAADLWSGLYSDWKLRRAVPADEILGKWSRLRGQLVPWPAAAYERWAAAAGLAGDVVWAWGPFRAWAWWKTLDR